MYNIMIKKDNGKIAPVSYTFLTKFEAGAIINIGFETLEEVDEYVEKMLNDEGYSKQNILVVEVVDFKVSTDIYEPVATTPPAGP